MIIFLKVNYANYIQNNFKVDNSELVICHFKQMTSSYLVLEKKKDVAINGLTPGTPEYKESVENTVGDIRDGLLGINGKTFNW